MKTLLVIKHNSVLEGKRISKGAWKSWNVFRAQLGGRQCRAESFDN